MKNDENQQFCPLCGASAYVIVFEDGISKVDCHNCGKYQYYLSVHPFLTEREFINSKKLKKLSEMAKSKTKSGDILIIDLEMYQKLN